MTMTTIEMAGSSVMFGWGMMFGRSSFWAFLGSWLLIEVLAIGLLYVLSVALLSPKPSNRMLVPRLYLMGSWAVAGVVMALLELRRDDTCGRSWPGRSAAASRLSILMVAALGERDAWSARVRRTIPRNPLLRLAAFLFYTGSAGGIALVRVAVCSHDAGGSRLGRLYGRQRPGRTDLLDVCGNMPIIFGYVLCYCLTTAFLRITVLRNVPTANLSVIAAFLGSGGVPGAVPGRVFCSSGIGAVLPWYLLGSPLVLTTTNQAAKDAAGPLVIGMARAVRAAECAVGDRSVAAVCAV